MNCHEITRIIDSGTSSALTPGELQDAESHASTCSKCAAQWLTHRHLGALEIPQLSLDAAAACLALADGSAQGSRSGRARRVTIVVGCIVALAAAAGMLVKNFPGAAPSQQEADPVVAAVQETAVSPPLETGAITSQPDEPATASQPATNIRRDIPLFPPQYAADRASADRHNLALEKLVELHPEVTQPLPDGMIYEGAILLRADGKVLSHAVRATSREDLRRSYGSGWGGLPEDGGESFGDNASKGTRLADGRTLGADLHFSHVLVRNDYDPGRSDRRVEEIIRIQRPDLMVPATETGVRQVAVLLSPAGEIEREVTGYIDRDAMQEREDWSEGNRADFMSRVLGVSRTEIGLMGSMSVFEEETRRMVYVDYAWRRLPGEMAPRYRQGGWDRFNPQGVDTATALAIVERVMPDAFLDEALEPTLGIAAILLSEEGEFIRTARIKTSDPREAFPGISIATFRGLVLKNDKGGTAAVYFMWQGNPVPDGDPR